MGGIGGLKDGSCVALLLLFCIHDRVRPIWDFWLRYDSDIWELNFQMTDIYADILDFF